MATVIASRKQREANASIYKVKALDRNGFKGLWHVEEVRNI